MSVEIACEPVFTTLGCRRARTGRYQTPLGRITNGDGNVALAGPLARGKLSRLNRCRIGGRSSTAGDKSIASGTAADPAISAAGCRAGLAAYGQPAQF